MNKWKMLSLALIALFVLTIVAGYELRANRRGMKFEPSVQLTNEEKRQALEVAKGAIGEQLTGNFTSQVMDSGLKVKTDSGETILAIVHFSSSSDSVAYRVTVDLKEGQAVLILEARDWMAKQGPPPRGPSRAPWFR